MGYRKKDVLSVLPLLVIIADELGFILSQLRIVVFIPLSIGEAVLFVLVMIEGVFPISVRSMFP